MCVPHPPVHLVPPSAQLGEANSQREEMVGLLGGYQRSIQELQVGGEAASAGMFGVMAR